MLKQSPFPDRGLGLYYKEENAKPLWIQHFDSNLQGIYLFCKMDLLSQHKRCC